MLEQALQADGVIDSAETPSPIQHNLTPREFSILTLLAHGKSNPEIGTALHLSAGTIRNYLSTIFAKLQVTDRTRAAVLTAKMGLVRKILVRGSAGQSHTTTRPFTL